MDNAIDRRVFAAMLAASLAMVARGAMAAQPWLDDAFRDEVIAVGRRHFPDMPFEPGRGTVRSGDHTLYLGNIYGTVRDLPPPEREAAIAQWLSRFTPAADRRADAVKAATDGWRDAQPLLRPRLVNAKAAAAMPRLVGEPYLSGLRIAYAIDLGDKDLYVSDEKFRRWQVPLSAVRAAAVDNLEELSRTLPLEARTAKGAQGRYLLVDSGDGYDAARLLLPRFRERLMGVLGPVVRVGVPARDLMVCWSPDFGRGGLAEQAVDGFWSRMPRPLTREVFEVTGAGVRPLETAPTP